VSPDPTGERFPRASRLTRRLEFEAVLRRGFRVHARYLVIQFLGQSGPSSRLGLTIPRKAGTAVVRNRLRRRLRELFRRRLRPLLSEANRGADVVVRVQPLAGAATFAELAGEMLAAGERWLASPPPAGPAADSPAGGPA
jgi:ribonuclease P protein component